MSYTDLIWFLLPVAAAAGWIAARASDKRSSAALWDYTSDFHRGLKHLLSDHKEQPSDLFSSFSSADQETADTHIALGNHYRQRGDMKRALLMHESVINNTQLSEAVRMNARFELARDFDSAGLLDRSEAEFRGLLDSGHLLDSAFSSLMQLHERESDWQQAIAVAKEAMARTGQPLGWRIAHYYCELAAADIRHHESQQAEGFLRKALECHPACARAMIMLASQALESGQYADALSLYEKVEALRPELMPEIIDNRFRAFRGAGDERQLDTFLLRIRGQRNAYSVIRSAREQIALRHGEALADRFFKDQILKRPSLKGLRDWARDQLALSKPDERGKVQVICDLLDQVVEDKPAYRCRSCGFQGNVMHWRCPRCAEWDSVSTIIGVEGE